MQKDPIDREVLFQWLRGYHEMSPILNPANIDEDLSKLIKIVSDRLIPGAGETDSARYKNLRDSFGTPSLYAEAENKPHLALDIASVYMDMADIFLAKDRPSSAKLFFLESARVGEYVNRSTIPSEIDIELDANTLDARTLSMVNLEKQAGVTCSERNKVNASRLHLIEKIIKTRADHGKSLRDGKAFEYALKLVLEFALQNRSRIDANNFVRMARTREDRPAPNTEEVTGRGKKVAHDVVYVRNGVEYRIQAKFGVDSEEQIDDYDTSRITFLAEENMNSEDLNLILEQLYLAFSGGKGSAEASEYIQDLADRYISIIIPPSASTEAAKRLVGTMVEPLSD